MMFLTESSLFHSQSSLAFHQAQSLRRDKTEPDVKVVSDLEVTPQFQAFVGREGGISNRKLSRK